MINDQHLSVEQSIQLRSSAAALQNNWANKLIKEQTLYEAIKLGVHSSLNMEMLMMSKAAIWNNEQERKLITQLAGEEIV